MSTSLPFSYSTGSFSSTGTSQFKSSTITPQKSPLPALHLISSDSDTFLKGKIESYQSDVWEPRQLKSQHLLSTASLSTIGSDDSACSSGQLEESDAESTPIKPENSGPLTRISKCFSKLNLIALKSSKNDELKAKKSTREEDVKKLSTTGKRKRNGGDDFFDKQKMASENPDSSHSNQFQPDSLTRGQQTKKRRIGHFERP